MPKKFVLPIFIILIMITGFITLGSLDSDTSIKFEGNRFAQTQSGYYLLYFNDIQVFLKNDPRILVNLTLPEVDFNQFKDARKVYLSLSTRDLNNPVIALFNQNLNTIVNSNMVLSCFEDGVGCEDLPLKTCDDVGMFTNIFLLSSEDNKTINYKNGCLIVKSKDLDKFLDKFILEFVKHEQKIG